VGKERWKVGGDEEGRWEERETKGGIPFRTPFCLASFPSHVRHRVYNSFLVTPMGLRHGLRLFARVHFTSILWRSSELREILLLKYIRQIWDSCSGLRSGKLFIQLDSQANSQCINFFPLEAIASEKRFDNE